MSPTKWSEVDVAELLPTGTVMLLLADVEGSTRLWESRSAEMADAITSLDRTAGALIAGLRPPGPW